MDSDFIAIPAVFGTVCWVAWLLFSTIRRFFTTRMQAELQTRLLQRFDSQASLLNYAETDAGRQFLQAIDAQRLTPYSRILSSIQAGIVFIAFGIGLLILHHGSVPEVGVFVFGTLAVTLGCGFVVAAAVSYALSRHFGLLETVSRPQ